MSSETGIEWCDATFNPWWGCERVSPACAHCYADTLARRRVPGRPLWGPGHEFRFLSDDTWRKPLVWARHARDGRLPNGKPNVDGHRPRVFCASMADVFEDRFELHESRGRLFNLIEQTPELDWLLLTKRPEFARDWLRSLYDANGAVLGISAPYENVWVGVSIENARYTWRADVLREIPAAVRFISAEPLLGSLYPRELPSIEPGMEDVYRRAESLRKPLDLTGIGWVIIGGESGPKSRPFRVAHARELVTACRDAGVAVFVKQLGARPVIDYDVDGHPCSASVFGIRDRKGGDWTEWDKVADLRIREFPAVAVPA